MAENIEDIQQNNSNTQSNSSEEAINTNLAALQDVDSYEVFEQGAFPNVPNMEGYILRFPDFTKFEVYLVLNVTEGFEYPNPLIEEEGKVIMVINIESLEYFINNLEQYEPIISEVIQEYVYKDGISDRELPYGYIRDENGQIKINPIEAATVKKIFKEYPNWKSIRKVASIVKGDYSFVHDILHDARYIKMPIRIVPEKDIRRAFQVIQRNRKNKFQKRRYRNTWG